MFEKRCMKFEFHKQLKEAFIVSILVSALHVINIYFIYLTFIVNKYSFNI